MAREWGIADNAEVPHCWGEVYGKQVLTLPLTDENVKIVQEWAETGRAPLGYTMDRDGTFVKGSVYGEDDYERPDRDCDPDCSRRFHGMAECDCSRSKDYGVP
jgi:hypothetical protein